MVITVTFGLKAKRFNRCGDWMKMGTVQLRCCFTETESVLKVFQTVFKRSALSKPRLNGKFSSCFLVINKSLGPPTSVLRLAI